MPKQIKYFYDTEFLEDGKTIDLISIGIVAEDGREFYAVSNEFNTKRVLQDPWLMQNVMSSIEHAVVEDDTHVYPQAMIVTDPAAMNRFQIKQGLLDFVAGTWPDFWAWYGAYDHVALCQLFGKMIDLPDRFPMFTCDLRQKIKENGIEQRMLPMQEQGNHNALADARHLKLRYDYVNKWIADREATFDAALALEHR